MKYVDTAVVFSEIPDEITLAINISECPIKCPDCHSKYLWDNIGKPLNAEAVEILIKNNEGISCICFMGGDADVPYVMSLFSYIRQSHPELKTAWYSGQKLDELPTKSDLSVLDFLKTGPYDKNRGPLSSINTNQRFYKITNVYGRYFLMDETSKFHKKQERE